MDSTAITVCAFTTLATAVSCTLYVLLRGRFRKLESIYREAKGTVSVTDQILISKKQLETIFDAIAESICIVNSSLSIVRVNKSYASNAGMKIRSILGNRCCEVFWDCAEACPDCPALQTFATGEPVIKKRFVKKNGDDDNRYFDVSTYPVFGAEGKVIHAVEFIRDVTEEKRMVEQLMHSEKLASIGVMTAGIAHEMNNPLSGISGTAANILQMPEKYGLNEKGISRVTTILESAARATTIMKDLLHLSRKPEQTRMSVDLNAILLKTIGSIHLKGASEVPRRYALDENLPSVNCDPSKIEQVIINIVTNAIQSIQEKQQLCAAQGTPFAGNLIIATQKERDNVLITVSDNGMGIPEKIRQRVFDPFFSTRPTGKGTGLGLSISYRLIEEHGGRLFFECTDERTVFSILLPMDSTVHFVKDAKDEHA